jgi:hypothetical protein
VQAPAPSTARLPPQEKNIVKYFVEVIVTTLRHVVAAALDAASGVAVNGGRVPRPGGTASDAQAVARISVFVT